MEYMEQKIQEQYDDFDERVDSLELFIGDLIGICEKHGVTNGELEFATNLFTKGFIPPLNAGTTKESNQCGECEKPIRIGEPIGYYDGEKCHMNCAAKAMDNETWDMDCS